MTRARVAKWSGSKNWRFGINHGEHKDVINDTIIFVKSVSNAGVRNRAVLPVDPSAVATIHAFAGYTPMLCQGSSINAASVGVDAGRSPSMASPKNRLTAAK